MRRIRPIFAYLVLATSLLIPRGAAGVQIRDVCEVQGARGNTLRGIGLVVGLSGTGDKTAAAVVAQERLLDRLDENIRDLKALKSDNCAVAIVTAEFPAFAKEGTRIDVQVASVYDCKSLEGGMLLDTYLKGVDDNVYAVAQGAVSVGGFNVGGGGGGGGATVQKNHVTAGRVPMGAYIEREIPSTITDGSRITLLLKRPDFTSAKNIQLAVNQKIGESAAEAFGAGAVNVTIPEGSRADLVGFIAELQALTVETSCPARVVINERTGTVVVGGAVMIKPCQVAHGNLTIQIAVTPAVSQPQPFGQGQTVVTATTQAKVIEEEARLMPVQGTSAGDVAEALNRLKVTPRDMIAIFQALREVGALEADLDIM